MSIGTLIVLVVASKLKATDSPSRFMLISLELFTFLVFAITVKTGLSETYEAVFGSVNSTDGFGVGSRITFSALTLNFA